MTFAKILLGVDNSVMPRQLLHSDRAPFFGILMMIPWFQSSGIFLLSHMVLKSGCKMFAVVTASALKSSALRRSLPGALWFQMIFSFFGGPVSTIKSSSASGISETRLTNLIDSCLNLLCLQSHSKPVCRWNEPEFAILGADQKERGLWGRECDNP